MAKENISPYEVISAALKLISLAIDEIREEQKNTPSVKVIVND